MLRSVRLLASATAAYILLVAGIRALHTACDSEIFCHGPILTTVQEMEIFEDSKTFVDMSLKTQPGVAMAAFANLSIATGGTPTPAEVKWFLDQYFEPPDTEFEKWIPNDWIPNAPVLSKISDPGFKKWAEQLNSYWKILGRKIKENVKHNDDRHSIIYLPNPFIIPGERFREFYYWDSYWIINGLLLSGMAQTARGMIDNFLSVVDKYGIVPNGGRIYYTRRSQPPFLTPIVESYFKATKDVSFIRQSLPLLEKEYQFWQTERSVTIFKDGREHRMARYDVKLDTPRPEGFKEDVHITRGKSADESSRMYSDLASACESGWDFSSRWLADDGPNKLTLNSIRTSQIIPVDLNAILWWNEKILAEFHNMLGNQDQSSKYAELANERAASIHHLMWDDQSGSWFDYDMEKEGHRKHFYPSNMAPLFVGCYGNKDFSKKLLMEEKIFDYLKGEGVLDFVGGIPTSKLVSGQQWDNVNSWPPLVHMLVEGLSATSSETGHHMAKQLAEKWLISNHRTWQATGHMYEKYTADEVGRAGNGGEYNVQVGFGWTNGVVLMLLDKYGTTLNSRGSEDTHTVLSHQPGLGLSNIEMLSDTQKTDRQFIHSKIITANSSDFNGRIFAETSNVKCIDYGFVHTTDTVSQGVFTNTILNGAETAPSGVEIMNSSTMSISSPENADTTILSGVMHRTYGVLNVNVSSIFCQTAINRWTISLFLVICSYFFYSRKMCHYIVTLIDER